MALAGRTYAFHQKEPAWLAGFLVFLGILFYLILAIIYAHTTISNLDEGAYLYKGYLFVSGVYEPFQPYGPLTNKAPLAFLIPGSMQYLFGPGLQTGRYFSILLGALTVIGTWIAARRMGGKWWGVAAVWMFALSPMIIKVHAMAVSEVLIAAMLAWILVLVLDGKRPDWQLLLGTGLASIAILTRQNMVFIVPFLLMFIFWRYGYKSGIKCSIFATLILLVLHLIYWPGIMSMWLPWLPKSLTPFLNSFRSSSGGTPVWDPSLDLTNRVVAFFQGIRHHLAILAGCLVCALLWLFSRDKRKHAWLPEEVFLGGLYFSLMLIHAWAAVGSQFDAYSCVYCFAPYLAFFDPIGILFIVVCLSVSWEAAPSTSRTAAAVLLVLIVCAGVGLSIFQDVDVSILNIPVPRMREGEFLPGMTTLRELVTNKFSLTPPLLKKYTGLSLGVIGAGLLVFFAYLSWSRRKDRSLNFASILLSTFVIVSLIATPVLAGSEAQVDCPTDIIYSYEHLGDYMDGVIQPGSLVYWEGGLSVVPFLYLQDIRIFPPQLNNGYSFRIGGDPDLIYRRGLWNEELKDAWMAEADVFIIEQTRYNNWKEFLSPASFQEYERPAYSPSCVKGAELRIFSRKN